MNIAKLTSYCQAIIFSSAKSLQYKAEPDQRLQTTQRRAWYQYWGNGRGKTSFITAYTAVTDSPSRYCSECSYDSETFFKDAQVLDFKVFWKWTLNHYNRIKMAFSLKNYWWVLCMHILNKADQDFNQSERRDIYNVSCVDYLDSEKFFTDVLTMHSISTHSLMSIISTLCPKRSLSLTLMISITFFTHTGSLMIKHTMMSVSGFRWPQGFLQLSFLVVDHAHCLIPKSNLRRSWASWQMMVRVIWDMSWVTLIWMQAGICSASALVILWWPSILIASSTVIPAQLMMVTVTAIPALLVRMIATAIPAWCILPTTMTATSMMTVVLGLRRLKHFCTDISPSSLFPMRHWGNLTWFSWRSHFVIPKVKIITQECKQRWLAAESYCATNLCASRKTLVVDGEDDDPIFSLLDHLISLALHDDAFEAKSANDVKNIFWVKMPPDKKSLTLKWKCGILNCPVFREPLRSTAESETSSTEPLRASTWIRYL